MEGYGTSREELIEQRRNAADQPQMPGLKFCFREIR